MASTWIPPRRELALRCFLARGCSLASLSGGGNALERDVAAAACLRWLPAPAISCSAPVSPPHARARRQARAAWCPAAARAAWRALQQGAWARGCEASGGVKDGAVRPATRALHAPPDGARASYIEFMYAATSGWSTTQQTEFVIRARQESQAETWQSRLLRREPCAAAGVLRCQVRITHSYRYVSKLREDRLPPGC